MKGIVKKTIEEQTFGFITIDGEQTDIFFHQKQLVGIQFCDLREGTAVTFEIEEKLNHKGEMKKSAINVQVVPL